MRIRLVLPKWFSSEHVSKTKNVSSGVGFSFYYDLVRLVARWVNRNPGVVVGIAVAYWYAYNSVKYLGAPVVSSSTNVTGSIVGVSNFLMGLIPLIFLVMGLVFLIKVMDYR